MIQCLVSFEMVFPPLFFNIMTHLLVHIVKEINILGYVLLHNMFPFERYMAVLKKYVRNRSRPEGCIVKGYGTEEVIVGTYQRHQRWRPQTPIWGGSISRTMNESASARNTAVAFYPGVDRGVIYISAGKAASERIYRLVGELYLDSIFSCINRGKIIIW